jgi:hypothetical protein
MFNVARNMLATWLTITRNIGPADGLSCFKSNSHRSV